MPRIPAYLSPTSISLYEQDPEQFYLRYLSDNPPPRDAQLQVMSIGSSFDAYVKSYLHERLYGKNHEDSNKFQFETIFESQVEKHNRDWSRKHGQYAFDQYISSGSLADLMLDLQQGENARFEFDVKGVVSGYREGVIETIEGVTLMGKPDVSFITKEGAHVILDFKVNGYLSRSSPAPGYIRMRGAGRTDYGKHKDAFIMKEKGININIATTLDVVKKDWANQLAIYSWLCGEPVGSDCIIGVDQLACVSGSVGSLPTIRVAQHRMRISEQFQKKLFNRICGLWEIVNSNHFFREMSLEDSQARCQLLDSMSNNIPDDNFFKALGRIR